MTALRSRARSATATRWRRAGFLLPAVLALLGGLDAALMLLGLRAPVTLDRLPDVHGMLLVLGFVGTVVALERAVALRHPAVHRPRGVRRRRPAADLPGPARRGPGGAVLGALAMVGVYVPLGRRQRDDAVLVQAFGAVLAAGAALLWLADVLPVLLPWLVGFVVLTIGGERLELARLAMGPRAGSAFLALSVALVAGVVAALLWPAAGYPLLGLALLALVSWLVVHDVARRTIQATGQARFIAGCLLAGYGWLAVAGACWLVGGAMLDGPAYDAVVHAVFLGFTLSMIMAHAPVILPAVLRRPLPYHPVMIAPAVLLHGSLAVRLWGATPAECT